MITPLRYAYVGYAGYIMAMSAITQCCHRAIVTLAQRLSRFTMPVAFFFFFFFSAATIRVDTD